MFFMIFSPNVSGSWRFAHIDVIPATGIMAFGTLTNEFLQKLINLMNFT